MTSEALSVQCQQEVYMDLQETEKGKDNSEENPPWNTRTIAVTYDKEAVANMRVLP